MHKLFFSESVFTFVALLPNIKIISVRAFLRALFLWNNNEKYLRPIGEILYRNQFFHGVCVAYLSGSQLASILFFDNRKKSRGNEEDCFLIEIVIIFFHYNLYLFRNTHIVSILFGTLVGSWFTLLHFDFRAFCFFSPDDFQNESENCAFEPTSCAAFSGN